MKYFTEAQAKALAKHDKAYRARKTQIPGNPAVWIVWDDKSDHHVEFDQATVEQVK